MTCSQSSAFGIAQFPHAMLPTICKHMLCMKNNKYVVRQVDNVRNDGLRESCGTRHSLIEGADQSVLRRFGHRERMSKER